MSKKPIYISIDIEADGPIPGQNSMLQFGAAAFDIHGLSPRKPIETFEVNLDLLPEAIQSPSTMAWWNSQGDAYANTRIDTKPPEQAMPEFVRWCRRVVSKYGRKLVVIGYPVTYDFMWLYWYTMRFGGLADGERCPFGFAGMDIKTFAAIKLDKPFNTVGKRGMPRHWFEGAPKHTHDGLDDAIGQGVLFANMCKDET